jgi:hypothetical protein
MNSVRSTWWKLVGAACIAAGMIVGETAWAQRKPTRPDAPTQELITQLNQADPAERQAAVEAVRIRVSGQPGRAAEFRPVLKTMLSSKYFAEAADLALICVLNSPAEHRGVEQCLQVRFKALMGANRYPEALSTAKSLFNIASMDGTSDAILYVAEALIAVRTEDRDIYERFRDEQVAGASTQPSTRGTTLRSPIMAAIQVDPKPYEEVLKLMTGEDYSSLMARGNLELLADHPKQAKVLFERMYMLATAGQIVEASEAIARAIKAEDGTIGRANAWVYAIRPKK